MKTLTLALALLFPLALHSQIPCLENIARPGANDTIFMPGMAAPLPIHTPQWATRTTEDTAVYKLNGGGAFQIPIWMPEPGRCVGSFASYDDRDDLAVAITDAAGNYVGVRPRIKGDIEIIIVDETGYVLFERNRQYAAFWSSGRRSAGWFDVPLAAGHYRLIINNRFSMLAPKSVTLTLGDARLKRARRP